MVALTQKSFSPQYGWFSCGRSHILNSPKTPLTSYSMLAWSVAMCIVYHVHVHSMHDILTLGAHVHEGYSTYFVCVCVLVCVSVPSLLLSNRAYMTKWTYQPVFRQFFLIFNSSICPRCLRSRERALFTAFFVVSNPHKRLCILLVI